jgi:DNA-binding response OmpR family regulator
MQPAARSRVLIADPDLQSRVRVSETLAVSPVELIEAESVEDALAAIETGELDLVLTELQLRDASGFVLCRRLRERADGAYVPVIVLSHWTGESDRILAFECGADDFVAKPYFARELSSRVEAVLRRRRQLTDETIHETRPEAAERAGPTFRRPREVLFDGEPLSLTPKERALLGALAGAGGRVLSRQDLIERVWSGGPAPSSRSVDSHIKSLRRKLAGAPDCVETVRGVGYRFAPHPLLELR